MKPKTTEEPQGRSFRSRLENMINMDRELAKLGEKINCGRLEQRVIHYV